MVRQYAQIVGIVIILIGLGGLVLGEGHLAGLLNIDLTEDIVHLLTGGLMAYVGFTGARGTARTVVGGIGVVYLVVGLLGFVAPSLFGLIPSGYTAVDNLIHLALGILGVAIAWLVGRDQADLGTTASAT